MRSIRSAPVVGATGLAGPISWLAGASALLFGCASSPAPAPAVDYDAASVKRAIAAGKIAQCDTCDLLPPAGYDMRLESAKGAIVMTTDEAHAGAGFVSLSINGSQNLVQAVDRGQGIQASVRLNRDAPGNSQGFNPTAQGAQTDGARGKSSSVSLLRQAARDQSFVRSVTQGAYWMRPGASGARNKAKLSDFVFDIRASANWKNNPNIVRWGLTLMVPTAPEVQSQRLMTVEVITMYLKTSVFTVAEDLDPATLALTPIPATHMQPAKPVFRSNPILISSADGSACVGLFATTDSPVPRGFRVIDFRSSGKNVIVPDYQWEQRYDAGVPAGPHEFEAFMVAGTKAEVLAAARLLPPKAP